MEDLNQDVLGVSVSPEGMAHLRRLASGVKWTMLLSVLMYPIFLMVAILGRLGLGDLGRWRTTNLPFYIEMQIHLPWVAFLGALNIFMIYLLAAFARKSTIACQAVDGQSFNESLRLLARYNRIVQLSFVLNLIFGVNELLSSIIFYTKLTR